MTRRKWIVLLFLLGLSIALGLGIYWGRTIETGSWGLSFQQEGQAPVAPAGPRQLQQYDAAYVGSPEEKVLYLTSSTRRSCPWAVRPCAFPYRGRCWCLR